jgi:archaellum component FlaG (FlaF/FlaG flagellin family)
VWNGYQSGAGTGSDAIAAVDLFANGASAVYYDDLSLTPGAPTGGTCQLISDIAWLSVSPTSGTSISGTTEIVDATFDSTGYGDGVYTGTLCINSNDITTPLVQVPVTMTVAGLPPAPPTIVVAPASLESGQAPDNVVNQTLTISNTGELDLEWSITETVGLLSLPQPTTGISEPRPSAPVVVVDSSDQCAAYENYPGAEPEGYAEYCLGGEATLVSTGISSSDPTDMGFAHDIRNTDNLVEFVLNDFPGQAATSMNTQAIFAYDFDSTATVLYALDNTTQELGIVDRSTGVFTVIGSSVPNAGHTWTGLTIDPSNDTIYASSTDGVISTLYTLNGATGAATIVGNITGAALIIDIAINTDGEMYAHDIGTDSIYQIDPGSGAPTLIGLTGYNANFAQGMDFDNVDGTLYIFLYIGGGANVYGTVNLGTGAVTPLATDNPLGEFEGATMTVGAPTCSGDIPWVSVAPGSGTTSGGNATDVTVTFDSTGLTVGNTYTGTLCIESNDAVNPVVSVPLTLTVEAPSYGVALAPDGAMSDLAGATVTYTLYITNTGNTADTFNLAATGNSWMTMLSDSSVSLNVGESTMVWVTVEIPPGVADGDMDVATVTATSAGDSGVTASATLTTTAEVEGYFIYLPFVARDN